jgi:large subunit ribosomal protein L21
VSTYAIVRAAGFQFRAEPGATLRLPSLPAQPGERVEFQEVLLGATDGELVVGRPVIPGARVVAEVVRHGRGEKIVVWKFRRRENYRRKQGHRQGFTEVRVQAVDLGDGRRVEAEAAGAARAGAARAAARAGAARAPARAARKTAARAKTAKAATARTKAKAAGTARAAKPKASAKTTKKRATRKTKEKEE